ncbi:response regulator [Methyloferula stellata]|uniref:response regulator n=1 Tax=Methyloferula stellata TaxID=876270 RepID=UPI00036AAC0D|nr:response regulator [Methyloferula stellata]
MKGLRILVAEDDALIGLLLAQVLEEMGHDICAIEATATNVVGAAIRCRPDLMIVDVRLADGSGISAVDEILRTGFVPHVFVTGDPTSIMVHRPSSVVIQKPFRESELVLAIQRAFDAAAIS